MMQGWRKAIIWLVLLWLPVQGFAAGFMPFACHNHAAADPAVMDAHHHDDHAHHGHELPPADDDDNASHDLACDNCSLCQMCGALALPADVLKGHPQLAGGVSDSMTPRLQSFIPALPHRPPRNLLVA
ncbi:MAG: hypothetical protein AB1450_14345 [Pseudomonadota bacterium]